MKTHKHKTTGLLLSAMTAILLPLTPPASADGLVIDTVSLSPLPATEGVPYESALSATGGTAPYSWALLPNGYAETAGASSAFDEVGEAQGWHADDGCWEMELPFDFPFYGNNYRRIMVNSNGTISFDGQYCDSWYYESELFLSHPMVAVLWTDLETNTGDIFIESSSEKVTVAWRCRYLSGLGAVNISATLFPNGRIVTSYGEGNAQIGFIGISAGDGETMLVSSRSQMGSMDNASDIVFDVVGIPEGLTLASDGTLSGTVDEPGEYQFGVKVTDANGETADGIVNFVVEENPNLRPSFTSFSPSEEYVNMTAKASQYFRVGASHPSGGTVHYSWSLDGEHVGRDTRVYTYSRPDDDLHSICLEISADDLPKTSVREWKTGVLSITDPESISVSYGMAASLSVEVTSSIPAAVAWYDADTDEQVGTGATLDFAVITETRRYYVVAESAFGTVTSAVATLTADPAPSVGRVYKLTGPAFVGNRLVLRAKPYGDLSAASFAWTRDGTVVSTDERLDIAALTAADFGEYVMTVTSPHGTATSEPFVVAPAPSGVPFGWGADGHGRTETPEGLTGVAQIASGMNFNLALSTNGTVTAWGYNGHGGCDVPDGLSGVSFVAAGGYESTGAGFAVKTDGTVVGWGDPREIDGYWDEYGHWEDVYDDDDNWLYDYWVAEGQYWYEYTNGWDTVSTIPADLSDVVQMAVGGEFAVALKADGSVVTWGREGGWWDDVYDDETGDYLGQEWVVEEYYAVPSDVTDVVAVAAGFEFVVTLHADGTVKSWGKEWTDYGQYDVPPGLSDVVAVAATKASWGAAASLALDADGAVYKWGDRYDYLGYQTGDATGQVAIDAGQEHFVTLDADGYVSVFQEWNSYGMRDIPDAVAEGGVLGVAAAGYHCTAILRDTDGDTIPDAEEALLGRDPNVWEDYHRTPVVGFTTIAGEAPPHGAVLTLCDATGAIRGRAATEEDGLYVFESVVPGRYFLKIEADDGKDVWVGDAKPGDGAEAPFDTFGAASNTYDFDLEPGQADAWARVVPRLDGPEETDPDDGGLPKVDLPDGTTFYLDMWSAEPAADGRILLGEVAASHGLDGTVLLPHTVSVKLPGAASQIPAPDPWVGGVECATVVATPVFSEESGSVRIVTEPAGAEVWIDYADESLGTTPLVVGNLAAGASHSHVLLLRKDGYLRPRPVEFSIETGAQTEVVVPLADAAEPAMSVAVSSVIPGMDIYLDYLPTGETTPATIGGMDPASHAGNLWYSASHSILLRHDALTPFAPRAVPEWEADPETGTPVAPAVTTAMAIDAPNKYEWNGPMIRETSPAQGAVNLAGVSRQAFAVTATSAAGAALTYLWSLDGESVGAGAEYTYQRDASDAALHSLRCEVSADGFDTPAVAEWTLGVLEVSNPQSVTAVIGTAAQLAISVTSSAEAQIVWYQDGADGDVAGRGPVLTLDTVRASASYHAVVTSLFGEISTASAAVTVVSRPVGDSALVAEQIATAAPGRYVPVIAAHGTDVVWAEHSVRDYDGDGDDALREWNAGYLGYVVAPEEQFASSGNWAAGWSNFRPLLTSDGLYYVAGLESDGTTYWDGVEEFRYRPVGGETMVVESEGLGTYAGENWNIRALASGRVVVQKEEGRWSWPQPGSLVLKEVTGGQVSTLVEVPAVQYESEWGTTYAYSSVEFAPNAVGWRTGETLNPETWEWASTGLTILRDGDSAPVEIADAPNARWEDANADSLLWREAGAGGDVLVISDTTGGNRVELLSAAQIGVSGLVGGAVFLEECEDGIATLKCRDAAGNVRALDQKSLADADADRSFHPVPYRGGVAWLHDTGAGTSENGGLEVRVWNGTETFVAATGVAQPSVVSTANAGPDCHWDEESDEVVITGWTALSWLGNPSAVFSRDMTTESRLVFERLVAGERSLCVWEGDAAGQTAAVIASGYTAEPFIALSVNDTAVAAALNFGTAMEPEYRVFAAYAPEDAPEITELPGGTEMVPYECDLAAALGVDDAEWSLYLGDGDFELSPEGVLSGKTAAAGTRVFRVRFVERDGTESITGVRVEIAANPNRPPVVDSATPTPGYANFGAGTALAFSVAAHDPEGAALAYRWFVDGEEMEADGGAFRLVREAGDVSAHNVRCEIADATWNDGNVAVEWNVGVLAVVSAEGTPIHTGGTSWLSVTLESSIGFYASGGMAAGFDATTWFDAATEEEIGNGNSIKAPASGSGSYYAVITTAYGTVQTDVVTVEVDPTPAVGRIYKRSGGPAVIGNRCVLHAAALGEQPLETAWTRGGVTVGTGDTLDIAALSSADFGTYILTVRNAHGEAASEAFVLAPAQDGTVVGWAQDGSVGSVPQERIDGAVQVAASSYGGVALKRDGSVVAWSENAGENGLADVPTGLVGVAQVAAARDWSTGTAVAAALKRDGSIVTWGNMNDWFPAQIPNLGDVVQIALGSLELVALRSDGTVAVVRMTSVHEDGTWIDRVVISEICEAGDAVGVFAAYSLDHAVLHDDGTLSGDFTADDASDLVSFGGIPLDWSPWIALRADGRPVPSREYFPDAIGEMQNVIAVDAQYNYRRAALLTSDGQVHLVTWDGDETPADGVGTIAVSCGAAHTLAIVSLPDIDPDVDPADSGLLAFLDGYGILPDADTASETKVRRAAAADADGDGQSNWAEYVAGTDPTDETKTFRADIVFNETGTPSVIFDPDLGEARDYVIESVSALGGEWTPTDNAEIAEDADAPAKFFRVKVSLPTGD